MAPAFHLRFQDSNGGLPAIVPSAIATPIGAAYRIERAIARQAIASHPGAPKPIGPTYPAAAMRQAETMIVAPRSPASLNMRAQNRSPSHL